MFEGKYCVPLEIIRMFEPESLTLRTVAEIPMKYWYPSTKVHSITFQETVVWIFAAMRTWDLTYPFSLCHEVTTCKSRHPVYVQGGAEPNDTFQMVIDNVWKQGKICETVYKYVQVCYLLTTDYKLIFWKLQQADGLRLHQCIVASMSGNCRTCASVGPHQ